MTSAGQLPADRENETMLADKGTERRNTNGQRLLEKTALTSLCVANP